MTELAQVFGMALVLYAMKALPFVRPIVPRTALAEQVFDLLPVALLMAMLLPPVLRPLLTLLPETGNLVALGAVAAAFITCLVTRKAALGIAVGLGLLALAEIV